MGILDKIKGKQEVTDFKKSYSQCGEDIIIAFIFEQLKKSKITYMDIGCHHPTFLSNTALFYKNGSNGVCVEPDPFLFKAIKDEREGDVCLNAGIGVGEQEEADFYVMSVRTLNTFSKKEAEYYQTQGDKRIEKVMKIPLLNVNNVMEKYLKPHPNMVSLDVEGYDLEILQTFDFAKYRPEVFCIETLTYTEDKTEKKITAIIDFMVQNGYFVYADTYINSIFIDKRAWNKR